MLLPVSLAMAQGPGDANAPIEVTFTKWVTTFPLMEGFWGDNLANKFVGEIFQRQVSQRQADNCYLPAPNCGRIIRLEALYEIQNGDRSFTALIRGGTSGDTGAALLDGTVLHTLPDASKEVTTSVNRGTPLALISRSHPVSRAIWPTRWPTSR